MLRRSVTVRNCNSRTRAVRVGQGDRDNTLTAICRRNPAFSVSGQGGQGIINSVRARGNTGILKLKLNFFLEKFLALLNLPTLTALILNTFLALRP
jgi:hypothetical protein